MLGNGCDLSVTDVDGRSVLMKPSLAGHHEMVKLLVGAGADPTKSSDAGCTPLLSAAFGGDVKMLQYLSQFQSLGYTGEFGQTALHYAAANGHLEAVTWLCGQRGVDVHKRSADGFTAGDLSHRAGHRAVSAFLKSQTECEASTSNISFGSAFDTHHQDLADSSPQGGLGDGDPLMPERNKMQNNSVCSRMLQIWH
eukprot:TRINITY_DN1513_c0_g1_i12.p1 TRINITY_DN1513_c0_g1~~TRINITY_DN1513_c0_g1_i12.p1  ORF type:complete len:196 (-),score=24.85 TRINITY_DN1513_c0_g1_i12:501-1088(-)